MIMLGWLFIASALKLIGDGITSASERQKEVEERVYELEQNRLRQKTERYNRDTALGKLERELALDKQTTYSKAADIESSAISGFTGAMEQTYLGQLGAEAGLLDLKQQGVEGIGGMEAAAGARGVRAPTLATTVIQSQIQEKVNLTRKRIDAGRDSSVVQNKANLDLNLKNAGEARAQFDPGSAYMDMYDYTRTRIEGSTDNALAALAAQESYLKDTIHSYDYSGNWFAAFDMATMGLNMYSKGYELDLFGTKV